jgi:hypothetical protein
MLLNQITPDVLPGLTPAQMAQIAVISAWDLSDVQARVKLRMRWSEELAAEAVQEYRKFIALVTLDPEKSYGMVDLVDEVWHQHLLNTHDYLEMCNAVIGGMIHHIQQPLGAALGPDLGQLRDRTFHDLAHKFVGPISKLWSSNSGVHSIAKCCSHISSLPN